MWVSIRPEDINMHKEKPANVGEHNWTIGTVKEIAYLGSFAIYHVQLPSGRMVKSQVLSSYWYLANLEPPTWDETVYLSWPANQPVPLTR